MTHYDDDIKRKIMALPEEDRRELTMAYMILKRTTRPRLSEEEETEVARRMKAWREDE
jgi:hypothetical protein